VSHATRSGELLPQADERELVPIGVSVLTFASLREIFLRFLPQLPLGRDYGTSDVPLWLLQTSVR
jgi:hypothetical protein